MCMCVRWLAWRGVVCECVCVGSCLYVGGGGGSGERGGGV